MKTKFYYLLLLCLMVLGRGEVWAEEVSFNFLQSNVTTIGPISIEGGTRGNDGYNSEAPITVSATSGYLITGITLTFSSNDENRYGGNVSCNYGSYSRDDVTGTWTGPSNSVTFTPTKKFRITAMSVTYSSASSEPYETIINISDLCYATGHNSRNNGLDRSVGGFNLTFSGNDGVKCNATDKLIVRNQGSHGSITVALDDANSTLLITQIILTVNKDASSLLSASPGSLSKTSDTQMTWTGGASSVTFTHQSDDGFDLSAIKITTNGTPTYNKISPSLTLSPEIQTIVSGTAGSYGPTATSVPANFHWTWNSSFGSTGISVNSSNDGTNGDPMKFDTTESSTAGVNTMTASFTPASTNPWFNSVANAATYTLTISDPIVSTPDEDATVQTYPYTWNFNSGSSTWGSSSTQLPISDWTKGGETYYNYNVPNSETSFNIDAIKGMRFQSINYLGLDWGYGHVYLTGGQVIIPSVPKGMIIKINASNNGQGGSATITPTNATYTGEGTATVNSSYQDFTFVTSSEGSVTFTFSDVASIKSISVQKNDLTTFAFNNTESYYGKSEPTTSPSHSTGAFIGKTTTFKYKIGRDQLLRTRVDVAPGFTDTGIDVSNFSVSSNASAVLDASDYSLSKPSDSKIYYWGVKVKKPGTASLTYSFNGTSDYNAKNYTEMFTIEKDDPELVMISSFLIKKVGDANFTRSITLNGLSLPVTDDNAGTVNVTYSSDNTSVATVSSTGEVTIGSTPGVAKMKITLAGSDWNNKVEKTYKLIVNPASGENPTLSWSDDVSSVSVQYNQNVTHTATVNTSQTVLYESADPSIATVDEDGVVTGKSIGSTKIYAYVDPTSEYNAVQIEYTVTVTSAGDLTSFRFVPNKGKVNNGKSITPKLAFPTIPSTGVTTLKVTSVQVIERGGTAVSEAALITDASIAACDIISIDDADNLNNNWILNAEGKVNKVNVTINGKAVGKAEITVTFTSTYYNTATATYTIEVTDAGTRNFSWADGSGSPEYYTYEGDFMMLPAISGNSNGNNNYSNGTKNSSSYSEGGTSYSALHAYEYERKWDGSKHNTKWNEKDLKIGEGFPDFAVVTDGISSPGTASVFFAKGEGGDHPDTLMVFCETAGDVKLRAYDPQDHSKYCDATIHILPISNIEGTNGSATTVTNGMTYPYTWDFTTNFDMAGMVGATDQYWIPMKDSNGEATGEYTNGYGFFNLDWADVNKSKTTNDRIYKHFIAGASDSKTGYMHQFNGMMLQMKGSTSWANRIDRMRIKNYDATNKKGRLQFIGGYHTMKLFLPESAKRPSSFKIFVKASGTGHVCIIGTNEKAVSGTEKSLTNTATVHSFDISDVSYTSEGYILLGFDDATVDWIAMSTEAKSIAQNTGTTYAASTYSYDEDLDFNYTDEIYSTNGFVPYYASSFTGGNVVLSRLTDNNSAPAMSGLVLKGPSGSTGNSYSYYMIAKARNTKNSDYSSPSLSENLLLPTIANKPIYRFERIGGTTYTNFVLASHYYKVIDNEEDESQIDPSHISGSDTDAEWSFVRVDGTFGDENSDPEVEYNANIPSNRAYLHLPNRQGNVDTGYEGASSRGVFGIIFEDDPEATNIHTINGLRMADNDAWYTLQGMKVTTPVTNGIYIHKGKKVVVK